MLRIEEMGKDYHDVELDIWENHVMQVIGIAFGLTQDVDIR